MDFGHYPKIQAFLLTYPVNHLSSDEETYKYYVMVRKLINSSKKLAEY